MSVTSLATTQQYAGNGATTVFAFPYKFLAITDLVVAFTVAGIDTTKVLGVDYTVAGAGLDAGGSVTFVVAPPVGTTVTIFRDTARQQQVDYVSQDNFPAETHETALDRLTLQTQDLAVTGARGLRLPRTRGVVPELDRTTWANQLLGFGNTGLPTPTTAQSIIDQAVADAGAFASGTVIEVGTIAALRLVATAGIPGNFHARVLGYYAAGDGGGGMFYFNAAAPDAEDYWRVFRVGAAGWYRMVPRGPLDLRAFGAKGNGLSNPISAPEATAFNVVATNLGGGAPFANGDERDLVALHIAGLQTTVTEIMVSTACYIDKTITTCAGKKLVFVNGQGSFTTTVGKTLTLSVTQIDADHANIFLGAGNVVLTVAYLGDTKISWWWDVFTDVGKAINRWHVAVGDTAGVHRYSRTGHLPPGLLPMVTAAVMTRVGLGTVQIRIRGAGGNLWDASQVEQHKDATVIDCVALGAGIDGISIGGAIPYNLGTVDLRDFTVIRAPRSGIVIKASGARCNLDNLGSQYNGLHGIELHSCYGSQCGHLYLENNGGSGLYANELNTSNIDMLIIRANGSASSAGTKYYGLHVLNQTGSLNIGAAYVERNWSGAAHIQDATVRIGAIYSEANNQSADANVRAPNKWLVTGHVVPGSVSSLSVGTMSIGAESVDAHPNPIIQLDGINNGGQCFFSADAVTSTGGVAAAIAPAKIIKLKGNCLVSIRGGLSLSIDSTEASNLSVVDILGSVVTTIDQGATGLAKYEWRGRTEYDPTIIDITANYTCLGHERLIRVNAAAGAIVIDLQNISFVRDGLRIIRVDNTANAVTINDGAGSAVRGQKLLPFIWSSVVMYYYPTTLRWIALQETEPVLIKLQLLSPPNIVDGATWESADIAVTNARVGDEVLVSSGNGNNLLGILAYAYVTANDIVRVRLMNETGAPIAIGANTQFCFRVRRPSVYISTA